MTQKHSKTPGAWSRRGMIGGGAAVMAVSGVSGTASAQTGEAGLAADIGAFLKFGVHRCGTPGERATAQWLAGRLGALGYTVKTEDFPMTTYLDPGGSLSAGDLKTDAFPQWRAPVASLNQPIKGTLRPLSQATPGCIAVAEQLLPAGAYWTAQQTLAVTAQAAGAAALVIGFDEPTDQIFTCNQESDQQLPLPVAEVRKSALTAALAKAQTGASASLLLKGQLTDTHGLYIAAHKPGEGEAIVLSTPLTGWFTCGAERGPGIALMIKLARDLAQSKRPVWLLATGAHELGHRGMRLALKAQPLPKPEATAVWVHLGAGIAAEALDAPYGLHSQHALTIDPEFEPKVGGLFPAARWMRIAPKPDAPGEGGDVIAAGYARIIGMAGGFPGFHTRGDDGSAVDFTKLAKIGDGLSGYLTGL